MPARWHCPRSKARHHRPRIGAWRHCTHATHGFQHVYAPPQGSIAANHRHTPTPPGSGLRPNGIIIRAKLCDGTKVYRPEYACCLHVDVSHECECGRELKEGERSWWHTTEKLGIACPGKRGRRMDVRTRKGRYEFWELGQKEEKAEGGRTVPEGRPMGAEKTSEDKEQPSRETKHRREPWFNEDDPIKEGRALFEHGAPLRHEPEAKISTLVESDLIADVDDPETWSEDRQLAELYRLGLLHDDFDADERLQPHEAPFQIGEILHTEQGFKVQRVARKQKGKKGQIRWWSDVEDLDDGLRLSKEEAEEQQRIWEADAFDFVEDDDISPLEGSWMHVPPV